MGGGAQDAECASAGRKAVEAILGVTVLLYLFGVVVALWP